MTILSLHLKLHPCADMIRHEVDKLYNFPYRTKRCKDYFKTFLFHMIYFSQIRPLGWKQIE